MNEKNLIKRAMLVLLVLSAVVVSAQANTIIGPPIQAYTTADSSKDIVLTIASSTYSADFSSYANYTSDVHSVAGYYAASGGAGWADIQHEDDAGLWSSSAYTMLGRGASGNTAWIAYKFVLEAGYVTASGGTISAHMDFTGSPGTQGNNMWVGASESLTIGGSLFSFTNSLTDQVTMLDLFGDNGYGSYHGTANLVIPEGVSEFYVLLADAGSTGYMAYTSLDVSTNIVEHTVTGPPIEAFATTDSSKDIVLTSASSTFSADFSSYANYIGDVHSVAGSHAVSGGSGWADIQHENQPGLWSSSAYTMLGRGASGDTAWVAYKLTVESGYMTAPGSTISANMDFTGSPATQGNNMWIGVSESLTVGLVNSLPFSFTNSFTEQVTMLDLFGDNGYNTYHGIADVNVPEGVGEFYVVLADAGNTGYMAYTSLDVSTNLVEGIPDPPEGITGPPIEGFTTADGSKDIVLGQGAPDFSADLTSYPRFVGDVHSVLGYYDGDQGIADIQYENGTAPLFFGNINSDYYAMVGRGASANTGYIVYKFTTEPGYKTSGGTISADVFFNGTPSTQGSDMWIGVNKTFIIGANLFNPKNKDDFTKTSMNSLFSASTHGNYNGTANLSIPADVTEFYVIIADDGSSARLAITSLDVNSVIVADPNICLSILDGDIDGDCDVDDDDLSVFAADWLECVDPGNLLCNEEWSDVPITVWGPWGNDLKILSYEWGLEQENELAISGSVLIHPVVGDSDASIAQYESDMIDAINAAAHLDMNNFMVRMRFGVSTGNWSGTSWLNAGDWDNAMRSISYVAQLASDIGIKRIIFDVETYSSISPYLFTRTEQVELDAAYQRGVEVGNAIAAIDPSLGIMLIPEHGTDSFWSYDSSGWTSLDRFRNGLMAAQLTGGVLVGLEGTYGHSNNAGSGGENDNVITLRINGVLTDFTDPVVYKAAVINYVNAVAAESRSDTDADKLAYWDNYCGVATGYWVLGTSSDHISKRASWYSPELFDAQLTAFEAAGAKLIWGYQPGWPFRQFGTDEVADAGFQVGGTSATNPDYAFSYHLQYSVNAQLDKYIEVLRNHGNVSCSNLNDDQSVDLKDFASFALDWMKCEGHNCL